MQWSGSWRGAMDEVCYFHAISLPRIPRTALYRRLGFRKGRTSITAGARRETEAVIEEALALITLKGAVLRLPVVRREKNRITLPSGDEFVSTSLSALLSGTAEVCLMGATAGEGIMTAVAEETLRGAMTRAVIFDATASEMVDAALDWIMSFTDRLLWREGKVLMERRYSAGYGDFGLENQEVIHRLLRLENIGVGLNEAWMLIPEKSVTAVAGVVAVGYGGRDRDDTQEK